MPKIDLRKELKTLYTASAKKAALLEIPRMKFLTKLGPQKLDCSTGP